MKAILKVVELLFIIMILCASNYSFAEGTDTKTLTGISITKEPDVKTYKEGQAFSTTGMVVTATYSDNTTKEITNYTYYPEGALTISDNEIEVSYKEGDITETATQDITVETSLEELIINFKEVKLGLKSNLTHGLIVQANPNGATIPEIIWTSSDDKVVTVTSAGTNAAATLQAVSVGTATITAKTADNKYSVTCKVTVTDGNDENVDTTDKEQEEKPPVEEPKPKEDPTTPKVEKLPDAGLKIGYLLIIGAILIIAVITYKKTIKYKGI